VQIAFALFPAFTALDVVGPFNVLAYGPDAQPVFVAETLEPLTADVGVLRLAPTATFVECPSPDVVVVPGGPGSRRIESMTTLVEWLRAVHPGTRYTTSVCTGAFALGAAGILGGRRATTHWASHERLVDHGAIPVAERVVVDGRVVTGAGVSAGIDMALVLAGKLWGDDVARCIQLGNEYDPQPPYDAGSPRTAPAHVVEATRLVVGT
jgi:transcriptional regulator GlxA family with amidase domain